MDIRHSNNVITFVYFFVILALLIIFSRLFYLQVIKSEELRQKAESQQRKAINLAKKRGQIIDRNGNILALDTKTISLYCYPKEYKEENGRIPYREMAEKISKVIDEKVEDIEKIIKSKTFKWIKRQMDISYSDKIKQLKIPGINYQYESKRVYPKNELAAQVIGFTGIDNQGLSGIEQSFEKYLLSDKEEKIFTDALGMELLRKYAENPNTTENIKTNKLKITIDENIQYIAEREIKAGVEKFKAKRGLAIIMDLDNGDLLALASYPSFNPNEYSKYNWDILKNWAITDIYEPGSTMKIFSIALALETGKLNINESVLCPGHIKVEGWLVHDHGVSYNQIRYLKPVDIIKTSSNIGTSIVTRRIPPTQHRNLLYKLGFGRTTELGLIGEVAGILPELPWRPSRQSTISFGQGISVTPIQMVTAMSAIPRKGIRIEPRIVKEVIDKNGKVIKTFKSKETRTLSEKVANQMKDLLTKVVEDEHGTGRGTRIKGYTIAGKTGTADKVENGRYRGNVISSFLGFFPVENPKVISFVLFDSPQTEHYASLTAVPVFKEIASNILTYLNIPPTKKEELISTEVKN
ncbi:MAG: stage V sporulation protein D [Candidatus Sericytochromatia bacterium]|nr:MAG: stage V sporulation protein D [Candidatus Sericytochromatia bacterium]